MFGLLHTRSSTPIQTVNNFWCSTHAPAVERDLFLLGYRNLHVHIVGHVGLSILVTAGAWMAVPHHRVLIWSGSMLGLSLVFGMGYWMFRHRATVTSVNVQDLSLWKTVHLWMVTLPGLGWGSIGFLFVPGAQINNLMVMTAFAGALAYSAVSNAHDLRGFVVSVTLASAIILSQLPAAFGNYAWPVAGMTFLYLSVMVWVARNAHQTLVESIRLRLANEILAQKNAEIATRAEQANRDKSEFLAAASHDLRQPVHALLLLIEAYRQQVPAAATHPLVLNIAAAGQAIGTLFNALMELSRLECGMEKPALSSFDLLETLTRLLARVRPEAERKNLVLRSHVSAHLMPLTLHTDKLLLERVLGNLLTNAVRYTERGGILLSLRAAHGGSGCWLEVWDTGLGIAVGDQTRIFDPYVQLANRERNRSKGLGLGLAIVRHASELLGLGLSLRSRLGRGSCFRLYLPPDLYVNVASSAIHGLFDPTPIHPPGWLTGRRLLLVDDDPLIQQAMQALLGSWGMDLRSAHSGDVSALAVCGTNWKPECVVCDFRLPGALDGIAMLDFLQNQYPQAVGILLTGELVQTVHQRAEEAGYIVLLKPVDATLLASALSTVLDRRSVERPQ